MIQLMWELLWPVALYELSTQGCRMALAGCKSLTVQTVSAAITSGILVILYRRNPFPLKKNREEKSVKTFNRRILLTGALLCIAGISSSLLFNNLVTLSGIKNRFTGYQQTARVLYSPPLWLQMLSRGVIISGAEELIFRGFIYKSLRKRCSCLAAILISSVAFGYYHGTLVQGVYAGAIGLVLAFSYERYRSVLAPWVIHGSANITSVLAGKWMRFEGQKPGISFLLITIISGLCLFLTVRRMMITCEKEVWQ